MDRPPQPSSSTRSTQQAVPPSHIPLPPPPVFSSFALPSSGSHSTDAPLDSPYLQFHTAPSSPYIDNPPPPSPNLFFTPPTSPYAEAVPQAPASARSPPLSPPPAVPISVPHPSPTAVEQAPHEILAEDTFPTTIDLAIDLALDDEGLSTLEKTYLFSRSKASFHRVFIAHALPSYLEQVTPQEAMEYVLPLLSGLAMDDDEHVKEALAAELVPVIWWFFSHCKVIADDLRTEETVYPSMTTAVTISVQAFTPILGTLLLSSNPLVGGAARFAVVDLLSKMKKADDREAGITHHTHGSGYSIDQMHVETNLIAPTGPPSEDDEDDAEIVTGLFQREERAMFQQEILQQVVIGMGKLDVDVDMEGEEFEGAFTGEYDYHHWDEEHGGNEVEVVTPGEQGNGEEGVSSPRDFQPETTDTITTAIDKESINPYFPVISSSSSFGVSSPASSTASTPPSTTSTPSTYSSSGSSPAASLSHPSPVREYPLSAHSSSASRIPTSDNATSSSSSSTEPSSASDLTPTPPRSNTLSPSAPHPPSPNERPSDDRTSEWVSPPQSGTSFQHEVARPSSPVEISPRSNYSPHADYGYRGNTYESEEGEDEQAAVGRLSSMSLMAAVTASGSLGEETKHAFVKEVERVGRDPVYWVRREASFALGALAKVVPEEVVICSLLPLFDTLRWDSVWHVRHSVLFALPAILSRLPPSQRRTLALETIIGLSSDESTNVRSGVLEALGEVLYTFHTDPDGPPEELIHLFLGRPEDRHIRDGQQDPSAPYLAQDETPIESFYKDPERPLICAFNFPAVALTLGGSRWDELRETYLYIAGNRSPKVRRTLAASLGELAKIIGTQNSETDLVPVWWDAIRYEDEDVRLKAIESTDTFVTMLTGETRKDIIQGLLTVWDEGTFRGWRERDLIIRHLAGLARGVGQQNPTVIRTLLLRALEDSIAAVREAGISVLSDIWSAFTSQPHVLVELHADIRRLGKSAVYRRRMTFIASQQALIQSSGGQLTAEIDDELILSMAELARDSIEGVRIGVARFIGILYLTFSQHSRPVPDRLLDTIHQLSQDPSREVRSYVPDVSQASFHDPLLSPNPARSRKLATQLATFSRPPPPRLSSQGSMDEEENRPALDRSFSGTKSDYQRHEELAAFQRSDQQYLGGTASAVELGALGAMSLGEDVEMFVPDIPFHVSENGVTVPG
ncbi:armadillo-type protein [Crucibulum laeve]|uniref:Armadillo-type protein n=1 Tax=Crucibulum laeve TaxID=68775 RepID=A0A5C3ME51_9AGAR|nr:armadillo-type protein [Crucibulum laeve]